MSTFAIPLRNGLCAGNEEKSKNVSFWESSLKRLKTSSISNRYALYR